MKTARPIALAFLLVASAPVFSAATAPASHAAVTDPAHVHAVEELLRSMQIEKTLTGIAARSRYQSEAQREAVYAKLAKTPPTEVYQRMAPQLTGAISSETAQEMTRYYQTPYGKQVIHKKYNSSAQIMMPGMRNAVPPEETAERKRAAFVNASRALAEAEPAIDHAAFVVLQQIDKEKR